MAKTITVSYSELDTFRQCPLKWELAYRQRWSKPSDEGSALYRGTMFHAVLESYYDSLKKLREAKDDCKRTEIEVERLKQLGELLSLDGTQNETQVLVRWMFERYLELYGPDSEWEILEVEHADEFWLPTDRGTRSRFKVKMKIDLIIKHRLTGKVWIIDHKTCKDLPNDKMLELDDQFGLYVWGMRQRGHDIAGAIHNACRTQRNKTPMKLEESFKRTMLYRTDAELETIAVEAWRTMTRAYRIPAGTADRAPNSDTCRWRCGFTEPCLGARKQALSRQTAHLTHSLALSGFEQNFERH